MVTIFIARFLAFSLPICAIVLILEIRLSDLGETIPIHEVHAKQQNDSLSTYFMRGIVSQDYNVYKHVGIQLKSPDILVVGSSRVMSFTEYLFKNKYSFYNAGGILQCAEDLEMLTEHIISDKLPKPTIMIIGLDHWWFKNDMNRSSSWLIESEMIDHGLKLSNRPKVYWEYLKSGAFFKNFGETQNYIGLFAKSKKAGFRPDGSKAVEEEILQDYIKRRSFVDRETPPVYERIMYGLTNRFSPSQPSNLKLNKVLAAIEKLTDSGIDVVVYLPPFSFQSMKLFSNSEIHQDWYNFLNETVEPELRAISTYVIPTENPNMYGLKDDYFLDGFHPSEVFIGYQMLFHSKTCNSLRQILSEKVSDLTKDAYLPLTYFKK